MRRRRWRRHNMRIATVAQASGVPILFLGNDSGLWRSLDGVAETGSVCSASDATHFDNLNAAHRRGRVAERDGRIRAESRQSRTSLIAGLGANGSAAHVSRQRTRSAPGRSFRLAKAAIRPSTRSHPRTGMQPSASGVNLDACPLGSNCAAANFLPPATIGATQVDADDSQMDTPMLLDPALTTSLLVGTCRVWRGPASSGPAWSNANALSPALGRHHHCPARLIAR